MCSFFSSIGWIAHEAQEHAVIDTPGGSFGLRPDQAPPRLELALSVPDVLDVEQLAELVESAGGLVMEPAQETVWGGWGFSFNDPDGNTWEIGYPHTVTAVDRFLSHGIRPLTGPVVALSVPRRLPATSARGASSATPGSVWSHARSRGES